MKNYLLKKEKTIKIQTQSNSIGIITITLLMISIQGTKKEAVLLITMI